MADNKRIAKNTVFLYIRMIIIMGVTLYTSRVVLDKLGVTDYGLYNAVGGVVGLLTFLNNTLATGTSRFITFSLGRNDKKELLETFSTAFYTHLFLCIVLIVILETLGLWFFFNKLIIPPDRLLAAKWVYQISLLTMAVSILQVPFTSLVIAHEDMNLYAYLGVIEVVCKLGVVYLLTVTAFDKMITYAWLIFVVQLTILLFFYIICRKKYSDVKLQRIFSQVIFKRMIGFSGWSILANLSETLKTQGSNVLINMFFKPAFVAAQAISNQVTTALMNFIYQVSTAINPQIIKSYAIGDYEASRKLTLQSTVLIFDLVLLICLPLIFCIEPILNLWLVEVPEGTVIFMRLSLISQIVNVFNCTLYIPMVASAKLKSNSIWSLIVGIGQFAIAYVLYKLGAGLYTLPCILLCSTILFALFIKPIILIKEIDYNIKELSSCYYQCVKVATPAVLISYLIYFFVSPLTYLQYFITLVMVVLVVAICSLLFLEKHVRSSLIVLIKSKIKPTGTSSQDTHEV